MSAIKVIDYDLFDDRVFRYFGAGDDLELWDVSDPDFEWFMNKYTEKYGTDISWFNPLPSKGIAVIGVGMHPTVYGSVDDVIKDISELIDDLFNNETKTKGVSQWNLFMR